MSPIFKELAETTPELHFCSVDVNVVPDVAEECGIQAMPTFMVFRYAQF